MKGLSEGQVTSIARTEIVSALHTRMLQYKEFPTPFEYKTVCRRLVEKYPCFVDKSESGYVSYIHNNTHTCNTFDASNCSTSLLIYTKPDILTFCENLHLYVL